MLLGTNIEHARSLNRRVVLELIRRNGPVTKADLARVTGLTPQAVSNISAELVKAGLAQEGERRRGRRGQPALELSINPAGGHAIGLNLGHQTLSGVLVDFAGDVLASQSHIVSGAILPLDDLVNEMEAIVEGLLRHSGLTRTRVWGVGCALPGLVRDGVLTVETMMIEAHDLQYPLAEALGARLGLPVIAENDARAAAIGERLHGIGQVARDFFYLHFGFGTGGGLMVAGEHYRGGSGGAGEIGHMIVKPGGRACSCGNRGCLEQYVSVYAAAEAVCGPDRKAEEVGLDELATLFDAQDSRLITWLADAAYHLRIAIHNIEVMFDPETIVIGGDLPETLRDALIQRTLPLLPSVHPDTRRQLPRLSLARAQHMPALGAAALPVAILVQPSIDLIWKSKADSPAARTPTQEVLGGPVHSATDG